MQLATGKRSYEDILEHTHTKVVRKTTVTREQEAYAWLMTCGERLDGMKPEPYAELLTQKFFTHDYSVSYYGSQSSSSSASLYEKDLALCDGICSLPMLHGIARVFGLCVKPEYSLMGWSLFVRTLKHKLELRNRNPLPFVVRLFEIIYTNMKTPQGMWLIHRALITSFICNNHSVLVNYARWKVSLGCTTNSVYDESIINIDLNISGTPFLNEWEKYFNEYPQDFPLSDSTIIKFNSIVTGNV